MRALEGGLAAYRLMEAMRAQFARTLAEPHVVIDPAGHSYLFGGAHAPWCACWSPRPESPVEAIARRYTGGRP